MSPSAPTWGGRSASGAVPDRQLKALADVYKEAKEGADANEAFLAKVFRRYYDDLREMPGFTMLSSDLFVKTMSGCAARAGKLLCQGKALTEEQRATLERKVRETFVASVVSGQAV